MQDSLSPPGTPISGPVQSSGNLSVIFCVKNRPKEVNPLGSLLAFTFPRLSDTRTVSSVHSWVRGQDSARACPHACRPGEQGLSLESRERDITRTMRGRDRNNCDDDAGTHTVAGSELVHLRR